MDYSIKIKDSSEVIVGSVSELLPRLLPDKRVVVVSDTNIDRHYHTLVNRYEHVLIGLGEASKTLVTADAIYKKFISMGVDRSTFVLAIGGGPRRCGIRRLDIHAGRGVRFRLDVAARAGRRQRRRQERRQCRRLQEYGRYIHAAAICYMRRGYAAHAART